MAMGDVAVGCESGSGRLQILIALPREAPGTVNSRRRSPKGSGWALGVGLRVQGNLSWLVGSLRMQVAELDTRDAALLLNCAVITALSNKLTEYYEPREKRQRFR